MALTAVSAGAVIHAADLNQIVTAVNGQVLNAGPPTTGTYIVGQFGFDPNGLLWVCTGAGTPGTWKCRTNPLEFLYYNSTSTNSGGFVSMIHATTIATPPYPYYMKVLAVATCESTGVGNTEFRILGYNGVDITNGVGMTAGIDGVLSIGNLGYGPLVAQTMVAYGAGITASFDLQLHCSGGTTNVSFNGSAICTITPQP